MKTQFLFQSLFEPFRPRPSGPGARGGFRGVARGLRPALGRVLLGLLGLGLTGICPAQAPAGAAQAPEKGAQAPDADKGPSPAPPADAPRPFVLASDLFTKGLASPRPPEVRMGSDYVIGSGDELALTAFGSVSLSRTLKVDRGGKVAVPDVGLVEVSGLSLDSARALIRAALLRKYAGLEQFNLEVVGLHDVEVMVIGEVRHPGSYLVPSSSSPMALLGLAGGPSDSGSYRNIRHLRGGRTLESLDLYRLRFEGSGLESRGFLDGDTLFVPLAGTRITAVGAFRRVAAAPGAPGLLMELAAGESALEAVHFAGGLIPSASQVLVTLQRTDPAGITTIRNIPNEPRELRAARFCEGDVLRALARLERLEEYVEAAGFVAVPGRFSYREGMRVGDLLALGGTGGQLLPGTYLLRGEILRTLPDGRTRLLSFDVDKALKNDPAHNLELQPRDRVELGNVADLRLAKRVTILGPFTRPGVFEWHEGMRAADLIYRAGIPKLSAGRRYAELASMEDGRTSSVVRLDLARLLTTEDRATVELKDDRVNPRLRPYDQITIYENPDFRMHRTVTILGQVQRPGPYVIQEDRFTLGQLIARAGGLTQDAMPTGGIFLRSSLEPRDLSARDPAGGAGEDAPSLAAIDNILQRLNETRRARESGALEESPLLHGLVRGELNRMIVDFPAVLKGERRQDVVLQDGDRVFIPRRTDSVCVVGEVASSYATFHVQAGDRVRDVLKLAGGYTRNADQRQVRLLKADGRVIDSRVERTGIEPGDALLVPQRIRKDVPWQDTLLAMTPIAILYNAIRR
jgi:protein involved in polysaccharide export with SLBB domain